MEQLEAIKKNCGFLIIPFFWLAYFVDFGVSHIHDKTLDNATYLPTNFVFISKIFLTVLLVAAALFLIFLLLSYISTRLQSDIPFVITAFTLACFGMAGPFKSIEAVPFQSMNLLWHLGSLASSIWLYESIRQKNSSSTTHD